MEEGYRIMTREDMVIGFEFEECIGCNCNKKEGEISWLEVEGGGWITSIYPQSITAGNLCKIPEKFINGIIKAFRVKI